MTKRTKKPTVTRAQAETVMAQVHERYGSWYADLPADSPERPRLVENWEPYWDDSIVPFAILWEGGDNWPNVVTAGTYDWEAISLAQGLLGKEEVDRRMEAGEFVNEPIAGVPGVHLETGTAWALCMYPA